MSRCRASRGDRQVLGLAIVFAIVGVGGIALYLSAWGGVVWATRRRKVLLRLAIVVPALLPFSSGIYLVMLGQVFGGLDVDRPVADIEGLALDAEPTRECSEVCYLVLSRGYAFVELEVRSTTGRDPVA